MVDQKQNLEEVTRRNFLKFFGFAALRTAGIVGVNAGGAAIQHYRRGFDRRYEEVQKETRKKLQENILEVKCFAGDLVNAAIRATATDEKVLFGGMIGGWFLGDGVGGYILRNYSESTNKKAGLSGMVVGRIIDFMSTYVGGKSEYDPRFKEYGLDLYFTEINPWFSEHPTAKELAVKGTALTLVCSYGAWVFPSIGRGYLGASPLIAVNNTNTGKVILSSLRLGDEVKSMIGQGRTKQEIISYLRKIN